MDLEISGSTALITGGSRGIGRAVAHALAAEGCNLHLAARTQDDLEATAQAVRGRHQVDVKVHAVDISDSSALEKLLESADAADILVNNAGAIPGGDLQKVDEATWRTAWDLKVFGYVNMTRAFYAKRKARGGGVIVNVIGLAGEKPDANYVAGTAGNASLMAFTRAVGGTALDDGMRVVAVNPGPVETERLVTLLRGRAENELGDASRWRELTARMPLGRPAKPEEVADAVAFLASKRAAYITGTVVTLDGGLASRGSAI